MKAELINIRPDARKESKGCNGTLEREEWRPVKGYEGLYEVSSFGRVKSLPRNFICKRGFLFRVKEKILKSKINSLTGYEDVTLCNKRHEKKFVNIHRLVMEAFVPNPDNLPCVNHRNEVKTSNYPDNMEWCTHQYNLNYGSARERATAKVRGTKRPEYGLRRKGIVFSPETKRKMAIAKMRPVVQLDVFGQLINEWDSLNTASNTLGISHANISSCCRGIRRTSGGFKWKYKSDYENELNQ